MDLNFRVMVSISGSKSLHFGHFKVNDLEFAVDPHGEAAKYGLQIYQRIQKETSFRETDLISVIYNGENDITEAVKVKEIEYFNIRLKKTPEPPATKQVVF